MKDSMSCRPLPPAQQHASPTSGPSPQHGTKGYDQSASVCCDQGGSQGCGVGAQPAPVAGRKKGIPGQEAYDKHLIAAPVARLNSVVEWHTRQAAVSAQTPQRSQRTGSSPFHAERRNTI